MIYCFCYLIFSVKDFSVSSAVFKSSLSSYKRLISSQTFVHWFRSLSTSSEIGSLRSSRSNGYCWSLSGDYFSLCCFSLCCFSACCFSYISLYWDSMSSFYSILLSWLYGEFTISNLQFFNFISEFLEFFLMLEGMLV